VVSTALIFVHAPAVSMEKLRQSGISASFLQRSNWVVACGSAPTHLYDRPRDELSPDEVELMVILRIKCPKRGVEI
jgi:hypothetical protein